MAQPPHHHDRAAIVSTGDEIVLGESLDTNSRDLAERLWARGIEVNEHVTLGDDRAGLAATLRRLADRVSLVIVTGGLGPTEDDLTREALADVLGEPLVVDEAALRRLEARFRARGRTMGENQRRQAMRPASARCIDNDNGTAPGLHAAVSRAEGEGGADVFCLPGPPREWGPMFDAAVSPMLRPRPERAVATRLVHTVGMGEGDVATRLGDLLRRGRSPQVGITVAGGIVTLRVRAVSDGGEGEAQNAAAADEQTIREVLGPHVFGAGSDSLSSSVLRRLTERGRSLSTVESCTGGMLGEMLTAVPGSSTAFAGGWITYSNALKMREVGVSEATLASHGAVSAETAREMALGGLARMAMDAPDAAAAAGPARRGRHCLSITGVAGPDGGTAAKPVGTVYIAHAWADSQASSSAAPPDEAVGTNVRRFLIGGVREDVRRRAATCALAMLHLWLEEGPAAAARPLLWQVAG